MEKAAGHQVLNNLQGLRGIAALMVCFYHVSAVLPEGILKDFLKQGTIGVQLFFMISGYIMVHTTRNIKGDSISESSRFLLRRFIRIAPLYYIATFVYIADDLNNGYIQENTVKLLKSLAFIPQMTGENGPYYGVPPLEVGWSLNYEMLFYVLLAISLPLNRMRYVAVTSILAFIVLVAPYFIGSHATQEYSVYHGFGSEYLNFASNPIMIHFIFGMIMAFVIPKLQFTKQVSILMMLLFSGIFIIYYSGFAGLRIHVVNDLLFCGLMFVAFLINDFRGQGFKPGSIIVKIGDSSYSLYLFHVIIFVYLKLLFQKLQWGAFIPTTGFFVFACLICISGSYLIYLFLEKRMHVGLLSFFFKKGLKSR